MRQMRWLLCTAAVSSAAAMAMVACGGIVSLGGPVGGPDSGQNSSTGANTGTSTGISTGFPPDANDGSPCNALEQESLAIRQQSCAPCHQATAAGGNVCACPLTDIMDDQYLLTTTSPDYTTPSGAPYPYLTPGEPENSLIYVRVANSGSGPLGMPPPPADLHVYLSPDAAASLVYPAIADLNVLQNWIDGCLGPTPDAGTSTATEAGVLPLDAGGGAMTNNPAADCQPGGMYGSNTWTDLYQCYFGPTGPDSCAGTAGNCHGGAGAAGAAYWICGDTSDTCYMGMHGFSLIDPTQGTSDPTTNGLYTTVCEADPNNNSGFMPLGCPVSAQLYPADMARIAAWIQAGGLEN